MTPGRILYSQRAKLETSSYLKLSQRHQLCELRKRATNLLRTFTIIFSRNLASRTGEEVALGSAQIKPLRSALPEVDISKSSTSSITYHNSQPAYNFCPLNIILLLSFCFPEYYQRDILHTQKPFPFVPLCNRTDLHLSLTPPHTDIHTPQQQQHHHHQSEPNSS